MPILVSIIIPIYNAMPYLEACLNSVAAQTYKHLEIIAINDGSTDLSENVLQRYAQNDRRFRIYSQANQGLGFTRNRGVSLSSGKYIFFLDSDDVIPPKAIRTMVDAAEKNDADYVAGKVIRFDQERQYAPPRHVEFGLYNERKLTTLEESPELLQDSIACNKLWKRQLFTENKLVFKEGKYYEDLSVTLKAAVLSAKIQIIDEVVYNWRIRAGEFMPSITQQQMKLENTAHRIEALSENRQWLSATSRSQQIIDEHDLKSLLDVIRLHVLKFALIADEEREQWKGLVLPYLESFPPAVAEKLPVKEKLLYQLVVAENDQDLMGLSQLLTNTEKTSLVKQESSRFVFQGTDAEYDITKFNKPKVIVETIEKRESIWQLSGKIWMPKASRSFTGNLYARDRRDNKELPVAFLELAQNNEDRIYPCEEQSFLIQMDVDPIRQKAKDATYDFYFRLDQFPQSPKTRVRLDSRGKTNEFMKIGRQRMVFYRTNFGNLSATLSKPKRLKVWIKKLLPLEKR